MGTTSEEIFSPHDVESIMRRIKAGGVRYIRAAPHDVNNSFDDGDVLSIDEDADPYEFQKALVAWLAIHGYPTVRVVVH